MMMNTTRLVAQARLDSPLGPLTLAATDKGLAFLLVRRAGALRHRARRARPMPASAGSQRPATNSTATGTAAARRAFGCRWTCTARAFQRAVWRALLDVPPGHTSTYGAIAKQVGAPQASRAAGAAIGRNPVAIIVPCHRIVGRDGSLTGFAGGLKRKEALLQHEGALLV